MGQDCDIMAARFNVSRGDQDAYAVRSHQLAAKAFEDGHLQHEIVDVALPPAFKKIEKDNGIRGDSTLEKVARLRPAFDRKFGTLTAANSSFLTDGAAVSLLMTEKKAKELGLTPKAEIVDFAFTGQDLNDELLLGPTFAVSKLLSGTGMSLSDFDVIEFHEAFAGQILSNIQALASDDFAQKYLGREKAVGEIDMDRFNLWGGSLSIGHPFGATGSRLVTTTANRLIAEEGQYGLLAACAADFIQVEKNDGIVTFWIDHQLESQNIVSPEVIEIIDEVFAAFEEDNDARAGVIISKKKNFIAGADIKSFAIEKKGDFRPAQAKGHASLDRLEKSKKPVVAAIHGACMGLGTELALACHARIASNDTSTKMALPEVRLGILPGGGGTQRLPRLIGIQRALDMMLTGKNIYAHQAKKIGLVDELTDHFKLHQAACMLAKRLLEKPMIRKSKKGLFNRLLEDNGVGRSILFSQARKRAFKQSQGNYPAVPAIIDCVEAGYKGSAGAGYETELELF
ncbi:unnamed protein product, partial [Laminaria digitata]